MPDVLWTRSAVVPRGGAHKHSLSNASLQKRRTGSQFVRRCRENTMEARTSRYHEAYARWQRDPLGFWAEAALAIDWVQAPKQAFDPGAGVYGRWFVDGV